LKVPTPPTALWDAFSNGDADATTFAFYLTAFVSIAIALPSPTRHALIHFARQVTKVTGDRFRLLLHRATPTTAPLPGRQSASVSWGTIQYGSLHAIMTLPTSPHLTLRPGILERLGQTCGWLLHGIETEMYVALQHAPLPASIPNLADLRPQERTLLHLMVQGHSVTAISKQMQLSRRTVENYQHHLYSILGVTNAQDAAYLGIRMGILPEG
jgi:DNA-binding CsgD family transcriptional regulator